MLSIRHTDRVCHVCLLLLDRYFKTVWWKFRHVCHTRGWGTNNLIGRRVKYTLEQMACQVRKLEINTEWETIAPPCWKRTNGSRKKYFSVSWKHFWQTGLRDEGLWLVITRSMVWNFLKLLNAFQFHMTYYMKITTINGWWNLIFKIAPTLNLNTVEQLWGVFGT